MDNRHDDALSSVLSDTKTISNFLDTVFAFLYRRTDFYHVTTNPNLGVGLSDGVAQNLVMKYFKKYAHLNETLEQLPIPEGIVSSENLKTLLAGASSMKEKMKNMCTKTVDSYNGADYGTYAWSQTVTDVDVQVKIPDKITSKQLDVNITSKDISIRSKTNDAVYLMGELCSKCKSYDTFWSFDGEILQIHLEKTRECWWDCLIQTEPKLDLCKMDCTRPYHELSEEAQAKIQELQWNQERKRQGLPTSDQLALQKTLEKAWNAEGSPFTGEYDPSKVQLN